MARQRSPMFEFLHHDGRIGREESVWRAIVAALGQAEANALPEMEECVWNYRHYWGDRTIRVAPLITVEGIDLGTLRELRD
jgi:hypothetical protein